MPENSDIFKQLAESITDSFFALDHGGKVIFWNRASEEITGKSAEEILGKELTEVFPRLKRSKFEEVYKRVNTTRTQESFFAYYHLDGRAHLFGVNVYPIQKGICVLAKDVTDVTVRKSEELFRSTLDNMLEGCAIFDSNWNYIYLNNAHALQAQVNKEEALGKNLFELVPGFEESNFFRAYKRTMEERIPQQMEDSFKFVDGSIRWYEVRSIPVPEGMFLLSIEITERKKYEKDLIRYQSILQQAERMAHLGSWWIELESTDDINSNPLRWSDEVYRIFGYEPFSVTVTNDLFFSHVHPDDRERVKEEIARSLNDNIPYSIEHRIIRSDGSERIVNEHAVIKKNKKGTPKRILGAVQDITEFKESLQERNELLVNLGLETDRLNTIIASVPDEIWVYDKKGNLQFINPAVKNNLGIEEINNLNIEKILSLLEIRNLDGTLRSPGTSILRRTLNGESVSGDEMVRHQKTGETRFRHYHSAPLKDSSGEIFGAVIIVSDITKRRMYEEKITELLSFSEKRTAELKTIIESIPEGVFIGGKEGFTQINRKGLNMFGIDSIDQIKDYGEKLARELNLRWADSGIPLKKHELQFPRALNGETMTEEVLAKNLKTGEDIYVRVAAAPVIHNGKIIAAVAIDSDLTEMRKVQETIKASLNEKDVLLRELYHRTKNNMQVISSLLGLKAADIEDETTKGILEDMKNRIHAIALVHQKLYQSQNLSRVNIPEYVTDLIDLIKKSFLVDDKVRFDLELDDISVLIDTAVPCGLIINELISNSLKYAFPGESNGIIRVRFVRINNDLIELEVSDNGIGFTKEDEHKYNLGLKLFHIIAEDQLQAETSLNTKDGVSWTVRFKDILYDERI
jgi:PAS domain S-box-containing protein